MIYTTDIIGDQWRIFAEAAKLGIALGGTYDILRILRVFIRFGKKLFAASDFIYWLFSAFIIFSFLLNENFGIPRLYIFLGIGSGFSLWYFTIGKITVKIAGKAKRIFKRIFSPFFKIFRNILKSAKNRADKTKNIFANTFNKQKSLLKKKADMVYNILCLNIQKAFSFCGGKAGKERSGIESAGTEKTEERILPEDNSYCLRGIYPFFSDFDPGEHKQKTQ